MRRWSERDIDLTTMDGMTDTDILAFRSALLTIDEYAIPPVHPAGFGAMVDCDGWTAKSSRTRLPTARAESVRRRLCSASWYFAGTLRPAPLYNLKSSILYLSMTAKTEERAWAITRSWTSGGVAARIRSDAVMERRRLRRMTALRRACLGCALAVLSVAVVCAVVIRGRSRF
jgi:hypothetical protein